MSGEQFGTSWEDSKGLAWDSGKHARNYACSQHNTTTNNNSLDNTNNNTRDNTNNMPKPTSQCWSSLLSAAWKSGLPLWPRPWQWPRPWLLWSLCPEVLVSFWQLNLWLSILAEVDVLPSKMLWQPGWVTNTCLGASYVIHISFTTGVLASPNYPSNYPNNLEWTSKIEVEEGLLIVLQFTAFDIESHPCSYCECDHLTIKDGDGTTLLEKACGWPSEGFIYGGRWTSSLPTSIRSRSNMVEIHFKTDGQVTKSGWRVTWSSLQWHQVPLINCHVVLSEVTGEKI